jgi:hypothetical protein
MASLELGEPQREQVTIAVLDDDEVDDEAGVPLLLTGYAMVGASDLATVEASGGEDAPDCGSESHEESGGWAHDGVDVGAADEVEVDADCTSFGSSPSGPVSGDLGLAGSGAGSDVDAGGPLQGEEDEAVAAVIVSAGVAGGGGADGVVGK